MEYGVRQENFTWINWKTVLNFGVHFHTLFRWNMNNNSISSGNLNRPSIIRELFCLDSRYLFEFVFPFLCGNMSQKENCNISLLMSLTIHFASEKENDFVCCVTRWHNRMWSAKNVNSKHINYIFFCEIVVQDQLLVLKIKLLKYFCIYKYNHI